MFLPHLAAVRTLGLALAALLASPPPPTPDADVSIVGVVTDAETGTPVAGAQLMIEVRSMGALSNRVGHYMLQLGNSWTGHEVTVTAHAVGYAPATGTIVVAGGANTLDFALSRAGFAHAASPVAAAAQPPSQTRSADGDGPLAEANGAAGMNGSDVGVAQEARAATGADAEYFAPIEGNAFVSVRAHPLSTFAIDVDRASYADVRRFISDGVRPPIEAVRIEELINHFTFDDPEPRGDEPLSLTTEVAPAPWQPLHHLVRIGLKGRAIDMGDAPPANLVFLIDVSGSMQGPDALPVLKDALATLVDRLRPHDRIALVVYGGAAGLVLPSTPGSEKAGILAALEDLHLGGSTAGGAGMRLAYAVAAESHIEGGNNRVVLVTDGDVNVGASSDAETLQLVQEGRARGTFLSVLAFGGGSPRGESLERIADLGRGTYAHVDGPVEAKKALVAEIGGTLATIARDVEVRIEFNPARVAAYRLIGYENRLLPGPALAAGADDARELAAGHSVTALYEVVPVGVESPVEARALDGLRYQPTAPTSAASGRSELMFVELRYQEPGGSGNGRLTRPVERVADEPSDDFRFAAAVAGWGMLLRNSEHCRGFTLDDVAALARGALGADEQGRRAEFVRLVDRTRSLELLAMTPAARD